MSTRSSSPTIPSRPSSAHHTRRASSSAAVYPTTINDNNSATSKRVKHHRRSSSESVNSSTQTSSSYEHRQRALTSASHVKPVIRQPSMDRESDQYWLDKYNILNIKANYPNDYDPKESADFVDYVTNKKRPLGSFKWQWGYRKEILKGAIRMAGSFSEQNNNVAH